MSVQVKACHLGLKIYVDTWCSDVYEQIILRVYNSLTYLDLFSVYITFCTVPSSHQLERIVSLYSFVFLKKAEYNTVGVYTGNLCKCVWLCACTDASLYDGACNNI